MRVLVVDDEPIARRGVRRLLDREAEVEIIGECSNGVAAIEAILTLAPDLVILDIQMPELGGLDVVATIGVEQMPPVVFLTAFDEYAVRAFDLNAVDYVLKPVNEERFARALQRVRARQAAKERDALEERLRRVLAEVRGRGTRTERFAIRTASRIHFVRADDIDWIQAEDNYVRIHAGSASHLLRETVTGMEQRLDPERFVRVRRSTIVRIDRIAEVRPLVNGAFELVLQDGTRIASSRRFRSHLDAVLAR